MGDRKRNTSRGYQRLHDEIVRILYRHDPIGIGSKADGPLDEYEGEAGSILQRLQSVSTAEELSVLLREEFVRWFDDELAGPAETYVPIAEEILATMYPETEPDTSQQCHCAVGWVK